MQADLCRKGSLTRLEWNQLRRSSRDSIHKHCVTEIPNATDHIKKLTNKTHNHKLIRIFVIGLLRVSNSKNASQFLCPGWILNCPSCCLKAKSKQPTPFTPLGLLGLGGFLHLHFVLQCSNFQINTHLKCSNNKQTKNASHNLV